MAPLWSKEDELILESMWDDHSLSEISLNVNRSRGAISKKALSMGLNPKNGPSPPWTESEDEILRELSQKKPTSELQKIFQRSYKDIRGRINELGLSRNNCQWTKEDLRILQWGFGVNSMPTLCRKLRRSRSSIEARAWSMGLQSTQGSISLTSVSKSIGYSVDTIHLIFGFFGMKLRRVGGKTQKYSTFRVSHDQFSLIKAILKDVDYPTVPLRMIKIRLKKTGETKGEFLVRVACESNIPLPGSRDADFGVRYK